MQSPEKCPLGWVNMSPYNCFVCGPKFTLFLLSNVEGAVQLIKYFPDLRYFEPFLGYSRSKLKFVKNRAEFWTFFRPPKFQGAGRPKHTHFITPDSRHIMWKKFCEDTPTSPEVIGVHTLNFKVNFKFTGLTFFGGTPLPVRMCASSAWPICSACKNFRAQHPLMAEIQLAKKVHFNGCELTSGSL